MTIGKIIKEYRKRTGATMNDVAERCGITKGYVAMLEKGVNSKNHKAIKPTIETILKICKGLGLNIDEVFDSLDDDYIITIQGAKCLSASAGVSDDPASGVYKEMVKADESTQMRLYDLVMNYILCSDFDKGRISSLAKELAFHGEKSDPFEEVRRETAPIKLKSAK